MNGNGSCWDRSPQVGDLPTSLCELTAGHLGAHRAGQTEWMWGHAPTDDEREDLAYLITAHRFRDRGLRGVIGEPDIAIARPLADFLLREGFRRTVQGEPTDAQVGAALESYWGHPDGYSRGQFEKMRAALRAAAATREGENRG